MATGYVANWGNDNNDGLTWETAKRSIQGLKDAGHSPKYSNGYFNELFTSTGLFGLDKTIWAGNNLVNAVNAAGGHYYNIKFINFDKIDGYNNTKSIPVWDNCVVENCSFIIGNAGWNGCNRSLIYKSNSLGSILLLNNNTIHGYGRSAILYINWVEANIFNNNIISEFSEGIDIYDQYGSIPTTDIKHSLFINSKFKFRGDVSAEGTFDYPTGATDADKLQNLKDRMAAAYGGLESDYLIGCQYYSGSYNDIFVDADNGDFHLVPNCIAAHMDYNGDYIGAKREGHKADWNADWTSIVNIDSNGNVIDQLTDATAETNIIDIGYTRHITNFGILGKRAARNGQQVNSISNVGSTINSGSSVLTDGDVYQVYDDTITLDDATSGTAYEPFECFTAEDLGGGLGLGFSGTGTVKQVLIDDYDQKIQIKTSRTNATLATATTITSYLGESPIMVNVDGNSEPTHGSADVGYVEGTAVDLFTRYIKIYLVVKANNLLAR